MAIEIRKAQRQKSKLRLGIAGPAGSGKTMGSLKMAKGLKPNKVLLIDTENGSGDLYAHLFDYDIIPLKGNYAPKNYVEAIRAGEAAGYDVIIIDSLSHAWNAAGGLLDQVDKKGGNSFTAWRDITPQHNMLVDALLTSPAHIIATMRAKTEYGTETDKNGKMQVKKLGLAPVQREGMDYEFTVMMDVAQNHYATVSKDRTNMFADEVFQIDESTGEKLLGWLNSGKDVPVDYEAQRKLVVDHLNRLKFVLVGKSPDDKAFHAAKIVRNLTGYELDRENFASIIIDLGKYANQEDAHYVYEAAPVPLKKSSSAVSNPLPSEPSNSAEKVAEQPAAPAPIV